LASVACENQAPAGKGSQKRTAFVKDAHRALKGKRASCASTWTANQSLFSLKVCFAKTRMPARCQKRYLSRAFGQPEWQAAHVSQFPEIIQLNECKAI